MLCVGARAGRRARSLVVGGVGRRAAARGHARRQRSTRAARRCATVTAARAALSHGRPIEVATGAAPGRARRRCGVARGRARARRSIGSPGLLDESAGRHARRTAWRWSAGAGVAEAGADVVWNLVDGPARRRSASERTVWVDGEPHPVGRAAVRRAATASAICASRAQAARAKRENYLVIASDYEQPFGTSPARCRSPGALARLGRDGAPRGALGRSSPSSRWSRRSRPRSCATGARPRRWSRSAARRVLLARRRARRGATRATRRRRSRRRSSCSPSLLVLGDGCERAGRVRRARGADRGRRARVRAAAARRWWSARPPR